MFIFYVQKYAINRLDLGKQEIKYLLQVCVPISHLIDLGCADWCVVGNFVVPVHIALECILIHFLFKFNERVNKTKLRYDHNPNFAYLDSEECKP